MDTPISPDVFFTGKKKVKGENLSPLEQIGMDYATPTEHGTPVTPLLVDTPKEWSIGDHIEAKYKDGQYYGATIDSINDDTYVVRWDEQDDESGPTSELNKDEVREYKDPTTEDKSLLGSTGKKIKGVFTLSTEKVKSAIKSAKKFVYQGKKSLKDALQKLQDTVLSKDSLSNEKLLELIKKERRDEIFGKLPKKCKLATRDIAEPFDAGSVQGPTLYGVGTGKAPVKDVNYCTYLDDNSIPMCWGLKIPLSFGLGGKDKSGESKWTGKSGGGTNHEMEHAIKCVTQSMLNGLAQRTTYKKEQDIKAHNLLHAILEQIGVGNDKKKISRVICQLLRKQQVIAGLPSCSLFNQIKCDIDLIKLSLSKLDDEDWFYVEVGPDKSAITKLVTQGICKDSKVKLTWCNFYGILARGQSAWESKDILKKTYESGGLRDRVDNSDEFDELVDNTFALKEKDPNEIIKLIMTQTKKVCDEYNALLRLNPLLSGVCIAASILLLNVSMNNVYSEKEISIVGHLPKLDQLGMKAKLFMESIDLDTLCNEYDSASDYRDFMEKIKMNQVTKSYLNFTNPGDKWTNEKKKTIGPLFNFQGGGGDFILKPEEEQKEGEGEVSLAISPIDSPDPELTPTEKGLERAGRPDSSEESSEEIILKELKVSDNTEEIILFNEVHDMLSECFYPNEIEDSDDDISDKHIVPHEALLEYILLPDSESKPLLLYSQFHNLLTQEIYKKNNGDVNELLEILDNESEMNNIYSELSEGPGPREDLLERFERAGLQKKKRKKKKQTKKKPTKGEEKQKKKKKKKKQTKSKPPQGEKKKKKKKKKKQTKSKPSSEGKQTKRKPSEKTKKKKKTKTKKGFIDGIFQRIENNL